MLEKYESVFLSYKGFKVYAKKGKKPEEWEYGDLVYLDDAGFLHNIPKEFVPLARKYAYKLVELTEVE